MIDKDLISELKPVVPMWAKFIENKDLSKKITDIDFKHHYLIPLDMEDGTCCVLGELYDGHYTYNTHQSCIGCVSLDSFMFDNIVNGENFSMREVLNRIISHWHTGECPQYNKKIGRQ